MHYIDRNKNYYFSKDIYNLILINLIINVYPLRNIHRTLYGYSYRNLINIYYTYGRYLYTYYWMSSEYWSIYSVNIYGTFNGYLCKNLINIHHTYNKYLQKYSLDIVLISSAYLCRYLMNIYFEWRTFGYLKYV